VEAALRNLEIHTGIPGRWDTKNSGTPDQTDGELTIEVSGKPIMFQTEIKREFREYHMESLLKQASLYKPLLLVADRIFPAQKEKLRQNGISYLDTAGNAYISAGEVLLWIEGQKAVFTGSESTKANRAFTRAGLKVVYALLQNHSAVNYSYREIATFADVALGTITEAMLALKESGYLLRVNKDRMILDNKKQLLDKWLTAYGNILKPSLLMGNYYFQVSPNWKNIALPPQTLWGGEPAGELLTEHLQPEQWTIYTKLSKTEVAKALLLAPMQNANLKIYKKFWTDVTVGPGLSATPPLITYADLMLTGDPRCIETANIIYEKNLSQAFEH